MTMSKKWTGLGEKWIFVGNKTWLLPFVSERIAVRICLCLFVSAFAIQCTFCQTSAPQASHIIPHTQHIHKHPPAHLHCAAFSAQAQVPCQCSSLHLPSRAGVTAPLCLALHRFPWTCWVFEKSWDHKLSYSTSLIDRSWELLSMAMVHLNERQRFHNEIFKRITFLLK